MALEVVLLRTEAKIQVMTEKSQDVDRNRSCSQKGHSGFILWLHQNETYTRGYGFQLENHALSRN